MPEDKFNQDTTGVTRSISLVSCTSALDDWIINKIWDSEGAHTVQLSKERVIIRL